jgi:hypothetical protein
LVFVQVHAVYIPLSVGKSILSRKTPIFTEHRARSRGVTKIAQGARGGGRLAQGSGLEFLRFSLHNQPSTVDIQHFPMKDAPS